MDSPRPMVRAPRARKLPPPGGRQSMGLLGFACSVEDARPETMRLNPRIGSTRKTPASRKKRPLPVLDPSRIFDDMRYTISPRATPPMPVLIMSLKDMGCVSPQHSHTNAPATEYPDDTQN